MSADFSKLPFRPADILIPRGCDLTKWAVVACDQYTSQPEYWQRVEFFVGSEPSALHLILPESSLDGPSVETDILEINSTMSRYLREGQLRELPDALIYVERTLESGRVRAGLVGMADLEQYDYEPGARTAVRATEGTVMSRIPPRVAVRKNAPIELPHAMLLANDPGRTVIEPLSGAKERLEKVYDFELMEHSGHLRGWLLDGEARDHVAESLAAMQEKNPFLFAVGDGNHSLATAKECYERQKRLTSGDQWEDLPSRFALCELVNLHDEALEFEPIHRVLFDVEPQAVLDALVAAYPGAAVGETGGQLLRYLHADGAGSVNVPNPPSRLPVATLQRFLDGYLAEHPGRIDYIHGGDVVRTLASQPGNLGFLLPPMEKGGLFPSVEHDGVLPRKTFSMGEAQDKRFYLEARKIR
ncbi:MAG: DUF1015 domain-containing protein [Clostridia bacterium]|nr:DUF1015 domain-containing protein [Clostridia bacterium]